MNYVLLIRVDVWDTYFMFLICNLLKVYTNGRQESVVQTLITHIFKKKSRVEDWGHCLLTSWTNVKKTRYTRYWQIFSYSRSEFLTFTKMTHSCCLTLWERQLSVVGQWRTFSKETSMVVTISFYTSNSSNIATSFNVIYKSSTYLCILMHFLLIVEYLYAFTMTKIVILGKQTYICCILISKGIYFTRLTNKKLVV